MSGVIIAISVMVLGFVAVVAKTAYSAYQSARDEDNKEGIVMLGPIPLIFQSEGDVLAIATVLICVFLAVYYIYFLA